MATQGIGTVRRSRRGVALVAVALAFAVAMLLTQATSIWSSQTGSRTQPVVQVSVNPQDLAKAGHIPPHCRPKYGCPGGSTSEGP